MKDVTQLMKVIFFSSEYVNYVLEPGKETTPSLPKSKSINSSTQPQVWDIDGTGDHHIVFSPDDQMMIISLATFFE